MDTLRKKKKKWLLLFINVVCIHATNQVQPVNTKNRELCMWRERVGQIYLWKNLTLN